MPPSPTLFIHYRSEKVMAVFRLWLTKIFGPCSTFGHFPHPPEKMSPATTAEESSLRIDSMLWLSIDFNQNVINVFDQLKNRRAKYLFQ